MLKLLAVKNYALLEDLSIDCEEGLTVITGETGAGKSMIVEALSTLCGAAIDDVAIRTGKDYTEITGVFDVPSQLRGRLEDLMDGEADLIIRRRADRGKRQAAYVNDHVVSLTRLKDITRPLIDLVGQYENLSLLYPRSHLALLDSYAGLGETVDAYRTSFLEHRTVRQRMQELEASAAGAAQRRDLLQHEVREIEQAKLEPGEEDRLRKEKELLASAEKRAALAAELAALLYESEDAAYGQLGRAAKLLAEMSRLDPGLEDVRQRCETLVSILDETYRQVSGYRDRIDFSAARLEEVMTRLDLIGRLKKKYGPGLDEIRQYLEESRRELSVQENRDDEIKQARDRIRILEPALDEQALTLATHRRAAAKKLSRQVIEILARLGMEKSSFEIRIDPNEPSETGRDKAEFFISTNPGEELKPLRKVASGGEISRITLALKTILSRSDDVPTIVFDEVDTGIGGRIAEAVGELLAVVSREHQILCITHLAQISVFARHHLLVSKRATRTDTNATVVKLDEEARQQEVARMIGGREITRKTREHAAEILAKGRSRS